MLPHAAAIGLTTIAAPASIARMLELRSYREGDAPSVRRLHDEGLREAGAHAGDGPWDDDLRAIGATYLDDDGAFLVGLLDAEIVAIGGLRRVSGAVAEIKRMRVDAGHRAEDPAGAAVLILEKRLTQASSAPR